MGILKAKVTGVRRSKLRYHCLQRHSPKPGLVLEMVRSDTTRPVFAQQYASFDTELCRGLEFLQAFVHDLKENSKHGCSLLMIAQRSLKRWIGMTLIMIMLKARSGIDDRSALATKPCNMLPLHRL